MEHRHEGDQRQQRAQQEIDARFLVKSSEHGECDAAGADRTRMVSTTCIQPGFTTMFGRVKIANVISVIGAQIFSASYMVLQE